MKSVLAFLLLSAVLADEGGAGGNTYPDDQNKADKTSKLMIHIPHSMYRAEGYEHRGALFGMPSYGGSISQQVYNADSTFCEPFSNSDWDPPFILMVDRGECSFVTKVRNAQRMGAAAVLIADNTCVCGEAQCTEEGCEAQEPIMADDGSGADISIPSFLMYKYDAARVKEELKADHPVQIEMTWNLPKPDNRVEYELWNAPGDYHSKELLGAFGVVAEALGKSAYFTPHVYVNDGQAMGCHGSDFCEDMCTNNGRYCATDPDIEGVFGKDVVTEGLRRLCIWSIYGTDGIGGPWWKYIKQFNHRCNDKYFTDDKCIKDAFKHAGINSAAVDSCMSDSGGTSGEGTNSKFDGEIRARDLRGVYIYPSIYVNDIDLRGNLNPSNLLHAICSGFLDGTAPKICGQCSRCSNVVDCVIGKGKCMEYASSKASGGGVSRGFFTFTMFLLIGGFGAAFVWFYKRRQDEVRSQVRGILAEYMPLQDESEDPGFKGSLMNFAHAPSSI